MAVTLIGEDVTTYIKAPGDHSETSKEMKKLMFPAMLLATLVWVCVMILGITLLNRYSFTPGESAHAPVKWPATTSSFRQFNTQRPTLLVFAHPNCSCTHATLAELSRLLGKLGNRVDARLVLESFAGHEAELGILQQAKQIEGLEITNDSEGSLAKIFGSKTSGQAMLFSNSGELLFQGGLTASRGHEGENPGVQALNDLILKSRSPASANTSVFGCKL